MGDGETLLGEDILADGQTGPTEVPCSPKQGSPHRGGFSARSNPRKHFLCDDALKR